MPMSPIMKEFLQSWWDSKDNPRGQGDVLSYQKGITASAKTGLCACLMNYCEEHKLDIAFYGEELEEMFTSEYLDSNHPFNDSHIEYEVESAKLEMHLNPARRAWVAKHLGITDG